MQNNYIEFPINYKEKLICISDILVKFSNRDVIHIRRNREELSKRELEIIFDNLLLRYNDFDFYWIDNHECAVRLWDGPFFVNLTNTFNELNKKDKLFFVDNNLGESKYKDVLNYKSSPGMIGFTKKYKFEISTRTFDKKFICLNRIPKPHRRDIFTFIRDNYHTESFLSFAPRNKKDKDHLYLDYVPETAFGNMSHAWPSEYQKKSFCNIVTESMIDSGPIHITEKTDKCFSAGQPFILVSGPNYISKLKELGFKTFSNWWDESYDSEWDYNMRISKIKNIIKYIGSWDIKKCEKIYQEMIPILEYNQNHAETFEDTEKYDVYSFNYRMWDSKKIQINENKTSI